MRHGLSLEVDRLSELIDKLENKVCLPFFLNDIYAVEDFFHYCMATSKHKGDGENMR